jgi:hypothetical protein
MGRGDKVVISVGELANWQAGEFKSGKQLDYFFIG